MVEGQGVKVNFVADLTLNNEGDCRFLVEGEELDRWQVLSRAFLSRCFLVTFVK